MEEDEFSDHESVKVLGRCTRYSLMDIYYYSSLLTGTDRRPRCVQNLGQVMAAQCAFGRFHEFCHEHLRPRQFGKTKLMIFRIFLIN